MFGGKQESRPGVWRTHQGRYQVCHRTLLGGLAQRGPGHIYCAWLQFFGWYQTLLGHKEEGPSVYLVEGENVSVQKSVFEVETKSLDNRRPLWNYSIDPKPKYKPLLGLFDCGTFLEDWSMARWHARAFYLPKSRVHSFVTPCMSQRDKQPFLVPAVWGCVCIEYCSEWKLFGLPSELKTVSWMMYFGFQSLWSKRPSSGLLGRYIGRGKGMLAFVKSLAHFWMKQEWFLCQGSPSRLSLDLHATYT